MLKSKVNERSMTRLVVLIMAITPMLLLYQNFSSHDLSEKALSECQTQIDTHSGKPVLECPYRAYSSSSNMSVSERQPQYQFFLPSEFDGRGEKRFPLVVHVETADFVPPKRESSAAFARALAGLGFVVALVRPSSMNFKWTEETNPLNDVSAFMRIVTSPVVSSHYKIDPKKVSLSGSDVGGYLALLEATRGEFRFAGVITAQPLVKLSQLKSSNPHLASQSQVFSNWFGASPVPDRELSLSPFGRLVNLRAGFIGFVSFPEIDETSVALNEELKNFNAVAAVSGRKLGLRKGNFEDYTAQIYLWNELRQELAALNSLHMAGR